VVCPAPSLPDISERVTTEQSELIALLRQTNADIDAIRPSEGDDGSVPFSGG
jgi:hypothetical protein